MAQADYIISNQTFPNTRADINNHLSAIATNNSGTSAPTTQYAGQFWIDTTTTNWTLYIHDGTDDIQFATIDTSANTVNFVDSALDVVTDTTPQLGGDLDLNSNDITGTGNINITGTATVSGDLNVDSNTLFVKSSNSRVGIGTNAPDAILNINSGAGNTNTIFDSTDPSVLTLFRDDTGSAQIASTGGIFAFATGGDTAFAGLSEAMRIDSSGNVGIGTSSPSNPLHLSSTSYPQFAIQNSTSTYRMGVDSNQKLIFDPISSSTRNVIFQNSGTGDINVGIGTSSPASKLEVSDLTTTASITIRSDRSGAGNLQFADQDDINVGYISYQHNNNRMVFRAGDNQQVYIDGAGCMMLGTFTPGSAGNGDLVVNGNIYLGGTGSANALDDYEESAWTPTIAQGYTGITYINQYGWYRKVGSLVVVSGAINFSATADGNSVRINLPFTQTVRNYGGGGIPFNNINDFANTNPYVGFNQSYVQYYEIGTGTNIVSTTSPSSKWISFVVSMATS